MQDTSFSSGVASGNNNINAQAGQNNGVSVEAQTATQQTTSIFSKNSGNNNINQSNSNSQGTGGVGNIFAGGGFTPQISDTTSIFTGMNRGNHYSLYSNKDYSYDVPKLTEESVANQKAAEGEKRTNPKAYNIDMTPKENPYAAFRNPEMQETSFSNKISDAISGIFGSKKTD